MPSVRKGDSGKARLTAVVEGKIRSEREKGGGKSLSGVYDMFQKHMESLDVSGQRGLDWKKNGEGDSRREKNPIHPEETLRQQQRLGESKKKEENLLTGKGGHNLGKLGTTRHLLVNFDGHDANGLKRSSNVPTIPNRKEIRKVPRKSPDAQIQENPPRRKRKIISSDFEGTWRELGGRSQKGVFGCQKQKRGRVDKKPSIHVNG